MTLPPDGTRICLMPSLLLLPPLLLLHQQMYPRRTEELGRVAEATEEQILILLTHCCLWDGRRVATKEAAPKVTGSCYSRLVIACAWMQTKQPAVKTHIARMQAGISGENLVDVGHQRCSSSMIHIPTKEAVVFQNTPCESAVEYRSEQKLTSPFLSILCVTEKKMRLWKNIWNGLWKLCLLMQPNGSSCLQYFPVNAGTQFLLHTDMILGIGSMNNSSEPC